MEEIVKSLVGKTIDVNCSGASGFRGEALEADNGVLKLRDEDGAIFYIAVDKISAIGEVPNHHSRPGFISA
jgi:hypothetical protein